MKYLLILLVMFGFVGTTHATIETTPFDIKVSSEYFYEPNLNKFQLVMKPGQSQEIIIMVTNNDSKPHTINLQMSKDVPRPERNFVFEPSSLEIKSGETVSSILTVSASQDASTGTTIWHTLIAKSTTFGVKSFGFYMEVTEDISTPFPDMVRRGHPGSMFAQTTRFDISEEDAIDQIPYSFLPPKVPEGYSFQGIYGDRQNLIYAKQRVSPETEEFDFWDNGGLLIEFSEKKEHSFDDYLNSLSTEEQHVRINGKNSIAVESKLLEKSEDHEIYSSSRVTVFLDNYQLQLKSQMALEKLMEIAESMVIPENQDILCGAGTELVDGVCQVIKIDKMPSQGDCLIATASFGSELAPQVQMLREIRDNTLLSTYSGSLFMNGFNSVYYSFSPTIAQWENENPIFKEAVKLFITPMISTLSIMTLVDESSETQVVLYGMSALSLIFGMYVVAPTTIIIKIKKRK